MYANCWKSFWQHTLPPCGHHSVFFTKYMLKFQAKYPILYTWSERGIWLCVTRTYTLMLLEYFLTSLRCIRIVDSAHDSITDPLMVNTVPLSQTYSQISGKITNFGHQINPGNVALCRKNRHPLPLECFITFPRYTGLFGRVSDSISVPIMVIIMSSLPNACSNLKQNNQFWAPGQPGKCDIGS